MGAGDFMQLGDIEAMVALIHDVEFKAPGPMVPWALLEGLSRLIPAEEVSISELDIGARAREQQQGLMDQQEREFVQGPDRHTELNAFFWAHYRQFTARAEQTGTTQVARWSDWYSPSELREQPMYREVFQPDGIRHLMLLHLPAAAGHERNLLFFRHSEPDFSDREKAMLKLLRPHLLEVHRQASRTRAGVLTPREWQVLRLAAKGHSNQEIARILVISVNTVRKHMEHIFDHAGVRNRSAAVAQMMAPDQ